MAGGPNKVSYKNSSHTPGIRIHPFPTDPVVREKWTRFVKKHRTDFDPLKFSSSSLFLCSAHFDVSCYTKSLAGELDGLDASRTKQFLARRSVPTLDTVVPIKPPEVTAREKRKVSTHRQYAVDLYATLIVTMTIEYGFIGKTH